MKFRFLFACALFCSTTLTSAVSFAAPVSQDLPQQELASNSAMLVDLATNEVLYATNQHQSVPIASVTKLMAAMVTLDAKLPLDEKISIKITDSPVMQNVHSRVRIGSKVTRKTMLLLTLMSSENRAATSLAHHYPGGFNMFVKAMNEKAAALGMKNTHYVEPTGLSPDNVSSANDLILLLKASQSYPLLGELSSTTKKHVYFSSPRYALDFQNTNKLVFKNNWNIALTKTGFTNKAGHCLVMLTEMDKRKVAFVVLDSFGKYTHMADANRLKKWLETGLTTPIPASAKAYKKQRQAAQSNSI
ncbi:D-alanyl-D-alanine endopeptidase [Shewanella saliphila]|uniref:D-alanyl-D-alanine endopeptidase n=1 Tax=Shewanella saliphila TaxID=2282698 RepID=A0ABQ2Q7J9_9GAMM|nr:D-alanyl-D-alanine endopeptidase [Shewanella saliphila]MCL1102211.1 D-alanyl-D-alanine endopeptidase [Shewanella saliphila]GGP53824.1 D-alanyl-D-alanine endopeptidase [Shewanella saliphila]